MSEDLDSFNHRQNQGGKFILTKIKKGGEKRTSGQMAKWEN